MEHAPITQELPAELSSDAQAHLTVLAAKLEAMTRPDCALSQYIARERKEQPCFQIGDKDYFGDIGRNIVQILHGRKILKNADDMAFRGMFNRLSRRTSGYEELATHIGRDRQLSNSEKHQLKAQLDALETVFIKLEKFCVKQLDETVYRPWTQGVSPIERIQHTSLKPEILRETKNANTQGVWL